MDSVSRKFERVRVGALLHLLRYRKGFSLLDLSSKVGIDPSNLSRIERGKYGVGLDILCRIVRALDATVMIMPNDLIYELFGKD